MGKKSQKTSTRVNKKIIVLAVAGIFFTQNFLTKPAEAASYKVLSVIDGDTIKVNYNGKTTSVRLIGVDAPETSSKASTKKGCYAAQAKAYLSRRLTGRYVQLNTDKMTGDKDYYGRLLRYVSLGIEDINFTMVYGGYAREYKFWSSNTYWKRSSYLNAQNKAKSARRGLWNLKTCSMNK